MPERDEDTTSLVSTPVPRVLPDSGLAGVWVVIGAGIAGFLSQWGAVLLWVAPAQQTTVWLTGGVMMAIALLVEPKRWGAVLPAAGAGQALLFIALGLVSTRAAIVLGLLSTVTTLISAGVLRRVVPQPFTLGTFREFLRYLVVVVVGGSLLASALYMLGAHWLAYRPVSFLIWRTFVLSAVLGYLTVTPALVLLRQEADGSSSDRTERRIEALVLAISLILASVLVFKGAPHRPETWPLFATVIPPLVLWAALRFTAVGASASVLLVTLVSTYVTARGAGPFTTESPVENTLSLQLFMLGTGFPLIGLAVVLGEHRRTTMALAKTHARLLEIHRDLLAAREEESGRIARELHDDVGQRLALVSIGLSRLRRALPDPESTSVADLARLQEQTSSIARSLRELSHELHPAALEHVGLGPALQMKCDEVARVTGLAVQMRSDGETADLPADVALCLFRVAQEAFTNVVRHSGASRVTLALRRDNGLVSLQISDNGRGFAAGRRSSGLGLHSAVERTRLVGGTMVVESAEGTGTTLRVNIPLPSMANA